MADPNEEKGLAPEELEAQEGEELPNREVMTVLYEPWGRLPVEALPVDGGTE